MKLIEIEPRVQSQIQPTGLSSRYDHIDLGLEYPQSIRHVLDERSLAGAQEKDGVDVVSLYEHLQLLGDL